jgi:hypothetical protein
MKIIITLLFCNYIRQNEPSGVSLKSIICQCFFADTALIAIKLMRRSLCYAVGIFYAN